MAKLDINMHIILAKDLLKELKLFNKDLWQYNNDYGWLNVTGDSVFNYDTKLSGIVQNYLRTKMTTPGQFDRFDVKEVVNQIKMKIEDSKNEEVSKGFYFLDGSYKWDREKQDLIWTAKDNSFTTETIQLNIRKFNKDKEYKSSVMYKYLKALVGKHLNTLLEHCGYHLANEHSGVALMIVGPTSIGKSTLNNIIGYARNKGDKQSSLKIKGADFMLDKGDKYAISTGNSFNTWFVDEMGKRMETSMTKNYNELIDESNKLLQLRKMNKGFVAFKKNMNLIMCGNNVPDIQGDSNTISAFLKRTTLIKSTITKAPLDTKEHEKLFTDEEISLFIRLSMEAYKQSKKKNKQRNDKFSSNDNHLLIQEKHSENRIEDIFNIVLEKGKKDIKATVEAIEARKVDVILSLEISEIINTYKNHTKGFSSKYNKGAFINELKYYLGNVEFEKKLSRFGIFTNARNGYSITWEDNKIKEEVSMHEDYKAFEQQEVKEEVKEDEFDIDRLLNLEGETNE